MHFEKYVAYKYYETTGGNIIQIKFRSAGVVVVRRENNHWKMLVLRCYSNWDFPKGMVEEGEEQLQAAMRETEEETSIADLDFAWGFDYCETVPYRAGKVARFYLAQTKRTDLILPINPSLGKPEHEEYRWAKATEAFNLLPQRLIPILNWASNKLHDTN
jgi:8-oxo-dGTP pyrophosphatase MutT (NUDIX family)